LVRTDTVLIRSPSSFDRENDYSRDVFWFNTSCFDTKSSSFDRQMHLIGMSVGWKRAFFDQKTCSCWFKASSFDKTTDCFARDMPLIWMYSGRGNASTKDLWFKTCCLDRTRCESMSSPKDLTLLTQRADFQRHFVTKRVGFQMHVLTKRADSTRPCPPRERRRAFINKWAVYEHVAFDMFS
jgi:hypothetical protein